MSASCFFFISAFWSQNNRTCQISIVQITFIALFLLTTSYPSKTIKGNPRLTSVLMIYMYYKLFAPLKLQYQKMFPRSGLFKVINYKSMIPLQFYTMHLVNTDELAYGDLGSRIQYRKRNNNDFISVLGNISIPILWRGKLCKESSVDVS